MLNMNINDKNIYIYNFPWNLFFYFNYCIIALSCLHKGGNAFIKQENDMKMTY